MSKEISNTVSKASHECLLMMEVKWSEITMLNEDKKLINAKIKALDEKIRKIQAEKKEINKEIDQINKQVKQINSDVVQEIERTANRHGVTHSILKNILRHDSRFDIPLPKRLISKFDNAD